MSLGKSEEEGKEDALKFLFKREALYYQALANGYTATDQEINDKIRTERESMESASNYSEFLIYLESLGLKVDDYWEWQFEDMKRRVITDKYVETLSEAFMEENSFTEWTEEWEESFNDYLQDIVNDTIEKENLEK